MDNSGKTLLVHKTNEEGGVEIDAFSGTIVTEGEHRPEWLEGRAVALIFERVKFYTDRVGPQLFDAAETPTAIAFEDLCWVGHDEDGEPQEFGADTDFRMDRIAELVGGERTDEGLTFSEKADIRADVEVAMDQTRTEEETSVLLEAQDKGFEKVAQTGT